MIENNFFFFTYVYMKGYDEMRQIIPFSKELMFSTKVNEVTSISLEHTISLKEDNIIKGDFIISGDYKMTASSINREKFNFNIPVEIDLDDSYDYEKAVVDIDNFYYEIVNDDSIRINIDLYVDAETIINDKSNDDIVIVEEDVGKEEMIRDGIETRENEVVDNNIDEDNTNNGDMKVDLDEFDESVSYKKVKEVDMENVIKEVDDDNEVNIFNTDTFGADTYATYYVYIVKDDDTIEKILEKFNTSREELSNYNDISEIKKGNKLIIPVNDEQ